MSEWISMSEEPDEGGFLLQLRLEDDVNQAEIRLLKGGAEVARGLALHCIRQQFVPGIKPNTHRPRPYDLHEDEMDWIAGKLGVERVHVEAGGDDGE